MAPSLNKTNKDFINLMQTKEMRYIYTVGTVIISGGLEGNFVVVIQYIGDSQLYTNIKEGRDELTAATIC